MINVYITCINSLQIAAAKKYMAAVMVLYNIRCNDKWMLKWNYTIWTEHPNINHICSLININISDLHHLNRYENSKLTALFCMPKLSTIYVTFQIITFISSMKFTFLSLKAKHA